MGLFGPSKSELEDRIEALENELESARSTANNAKQNAERAHRRARKAEERATEKAEMAAEIAHSLSDLHTPEAGDLDDKSGVVEKLDEPKIVWKATRQHIAKLLLPEGTTVVHPNHGEKKRADQAIVLAFHNVETCFEDRLTTMTEEYVDPDPACVIEDRSNYLASFQYKIGDTVTPNEKLNTDITVACESGIHFFTTQDRALDWY